MKVKRQHWNVEVFKLAVFLVTVGSSVGKQCVKVNACSCVFDDGSGIADLSSTGNKNGKPRFPDYTAFDAFLYSYNPCYDFTDGSCVNVAVCQTDYSKTMFYNLGTQDTAQWSYDGSNLQIYYYAETDTMRETFVTAICDPSYKEPFVAVQGSQGTQQYYLDIRTECACPNTCATATPIEITVSLSVGTVLLIIVLVGGFLYVAIGMGVMRTRYQATGADMLPNRTLWGALPGLIKDGFVFTVGLVRGTSKRSSYEQV